MDGRENEVWQLQGLIETRPLRMGLKHLSDPFDPIFMGNRREMSEICMVWCGNTLLPHQTTSITLNLLPVVIPQCTINYSTLRMRLLLREVGEWGGT